MLCHIGAEETLEAFTENLVGAQAGEHRRFEVDYPADYPDQKLAGKKYTYAAEVLGIKEKKLPELNDEFAKDVSDSQTLEELRGKVRAGSREPSASSGTTPRCATRCWPRSSPRTISRCPKRWWKTRWTCAWSAPCASLAAQGVDPRAVNVDWVAMRRRQRDRAVEDVKAELLLDRIATAENIEAADEDVDARSPAMAERSGESAAAVRASLTKQGALDRMKSKLRSDKTLEWLQQNSRVRTREPERS